MIPRQRNPRHKKIRRRSTLPATMTIAAQPAAGPVAEPAAEPAPVQAAVAAAGLTNAIIANTNNELPLLCNYISLENLISKEKVKVKAKVKAKVKVKVKVKAAKAN